MDWAVRSARSGSVAATALATVASALALAGRHMRPVHRRPLTRQSPIGSWRLKGRPVEQG
jgi:hypothetical protein